MITATLSGTSQEAPEQLSAAVHSGFLGLAAIAQYHRRPCDATELARRVGLERGNVTPAQLILAGRLAGLIVKSGQLFWEDLARQSFPLLAELRNGEYVILARAEQGRIIALDPRVGQIVFDPASFSADASGHVLFVKPRLRMDEEPVRFGLRWFLPALFKFRKPVIDALLAAFVVQMFALAMPLFTQLLIDKVLVHRSLPTLNVLAIGMLLVIGFEAALNVLKTLLITHTSNRIDVTLGARVFAHMLQLPLRYFELRTVGSTVARLRELDSIRQFLTGPTLVALIDVVFVGVFLLVMLLYSIPLTLVVLASLPFMVMLSLLIFPLLRRLLQAKFDRGAEVQSFLVETVTGMQTVKTLAVEGRMNQRWEERLSRYVRASYEVDRLAGITASVSQTIQRLGTLALLWVGVHLALDGRISVGQLVAFQMISGQVTGPVLRLAQLWQNFQQVGVSVDRIGDLMNTATEPISSVRNGSTSVAADVRFDKVSFRYSADGPIVLDNISFNLPPGTFLGLVGRSGSGKSTLIKLLQKLYQPSSGTISVNGQDLRHMDPGAWRRQIGTVMQDDMLFSGTLHDNITMSWPDAPQDQVEVAARLAGAHDFITRMPESYGTVIGERGEGLSGGQRQRIALARALLTQPHLLVFDEATSAMDAESESIVRANLGRIREGRTLVVSAHRLVTIRDADVILVIDDGHIAESGSHSELMAKGGVYATLWAAQEGAA